MITFGNIVARLCFEKYSSLKKTGKPCDNEWTVLCGIVMQDDKGTLSVVSLATGTKCLSGTELMNEESWKRGSRLSDSHAEVLTRRAFLRYLYHEINSTLCDCGSIFLLSGDGSVKLKDGVSFHFFCSQTPCGDCSIFPIANEEGSGGGGFGKRRKLENVDYREQNDMEEFSGMAVFNDLHRTGAKCVSTERVRDSHEAGMNYHIVGLMRTKPGRGDPTLSLSCSDKMARWNAVGIQGALLSLIITPIRMESFIIGGGYPFSLEAMKRGIYGRFAMEMHPTILQADPIFVEGKGAARTQPCPSSIIWCAVPNRQLEVAVEGRKQGVTKKKKGNYLLVSRLELLRTFLRTFEDYHRSTDRQSHPKKVTYFHLKQSSACYQDSWRKLKLGSFRAWPSKQSNLQDFIL